MSADNYTEVLRSLGLRFLAAKDLGYYQGDWVGLIHDDDANRFGLVIIGYGSCSGCDEWYAAETIERKLEIIQKIVAGVKWFDSLDLAKVYINDATIQETQWHSHEEGWSEFLADVAVADEYTRV